MCDSQLDEMNEDELIEHLNQLNLDCGEFTVNRTRLMSGNTEELFKGIVAAKEMMVRKGFATEFVNESEDHPTCNEPRRGSITLKTGDGEVKEILPHEPISDHLTSNTFSCIY